MDSMITVNKAVKIYNENTPSAFRALDEISIEIKKGDFAAIAGPNGSGKTSLLNLIGALDVTSSGYIKIRDINTMLIALDHSASRKQVRIGFLLQDDHLLDEMTVRDNLLVPLALSGRKGNPEDLLSVFGMQDTTDKFPYQLSVGQRLKVSLLRVLISEPEVIVADEPTGNLDVQSGVEVMELLKNYSRQKETTVIIVTHDPEVVYHCDYCLFINEGKIWKKVERDHEYCTKVNDAFEELMEARRI